MKITDLASAGLMALVMMSITSAHACTRVLYVEKNQAVMVGRNMDWMDELNTNLRVYPRGIARNGMSGDHSMQWRAKYGSINAISYGVENTDGMNEKGLAAHLLWLDAADYGTRDPAREGLNVLMWAQYYLDNFATVAEAVAYTETHPFQLVDFNPSERIPALKVKSLPLHLALDDATGDSAVFEYVAGKLHIYHNRDYTVLTNDPTYDQQLDNLRQYAGLGGKKPMPGTVDAKDRFVRGAYYSKNLPASSDYAAEFASLHSVMQNVAEPYSVVNADTPDPIPTVWRVIGDLTNKKYYFDSSNRLNIIWAQLSDFNLAEGSPIMELDVHTSEELTGNVRAKFKPLVKKA